MGTQGTKVCPVNDTRLVSLGFSLPFFLTLPGRQPTLEGLYLFHRAGTKNCDSGRTNTEKWQLKR